MNTLDERTIGIILGAIVFAFGAYKFNLPLMARNFFTSKKAA